MKCSKCDWDSDAGSTFCESCGEPLPHADNAAAGVVAASVAQALSTSGDAGGLACTSCGAGPDKIDHNVCTVCGEIVEPKKPRDHFEIRLDERRGAQSDLGRKHWRNEDFVAMASVELEGTSGTLFVVSDGVSSSERPDEASEGACKAALDAVQQALTNGTEREAAVRLGVEAAQNAVLQIPWSEHTKKEPPEATLLIVLVHGTTATIGWLGDSRAYAVSQDAAGGTHASLLTEDHSWVNEVVHAGVMSLEDALKDKRAHAVTQSLGQVPEGDTLDPSIKTLPLDGYHYLLGCTDGFWNYAHLQQDRPPAGLIGLFHEAAPDTEAVALARRCVNFANDHGGHDNISVAVVALSTTKGTG